MEVMRIEPQTITHLQEWLGKSELLTDTVTAAPVRALSATLDREDPSPSQGSFLPELWHWLYFLPHARESEIVQMVIPNVAASCHQCRCHAACGQEVASSG